MALVVKNLPANAGDIRDAGSIPRSGRFPGGGYGNHVGFHGQRSLVGYSPQGHKESDMTEVTPQHGDLELQHLCAPVLACNLAIFPLPDFRSSRRHPGSWMLAVGT